MRLPISGTRVNWRPGSGNDDIVVAESGPDVSGALACAAAMITDEAPQGWNALPLADLDAIIAMRRAHVIGDAFIAEGTCADCGATVDVRFGIADYLAHHAPSSPRGAVLGKDGWCELTPSLAVRVPTVGDVLTAEDATDPRAELLGRCVRSDAPLTARLRATAVRAIALLAPALDDDVEGRCPECGETLLLAVDLRGLCLCELRFLAQGIFDDVHLIAAAYGWSEAEILALPTARRQRYAELIAGRTARAVADEMISVG